NGRLHSRPRRARPGRVPASHHRRGHRAPWALTQIPRRHAAAQPPWRSATTAMTAPRPLVPVFAPYATVPESPEDNDYDSPEFRADVQSWFAPLPVDWEWVQVTTENVGRVVGDAARAAKERPVIVLHLCDGTDDNGYPGVSVLRALESAGLAATGVDSQFYEVSTSKLAMKQRFAAAGVPTSPWVEIVDVETDVRRAEAELGWPLFLKPDISGGSVGISLRSRARNHREAT